MLFVKIMSANSELFKTLPFATWLSALFLQSTKTVFLNRFMHIDSECNPHLPYRPHTQPIAYAILDAWLFVFPFSATQNAVVQPLLPLWLTINWAFKPICCTKAVHKQKLTKVFANVIYKKGNSDAKLAFLLPFPSSSSHRNRSETFEYFVRLTVILLLLLLYKLFRVPLWLRQPIHLND